MIRMHEGLRCSVRYDIEYHPRSLESWKNVWRGQMFSKTWYQLPSKVLRVMKRIHEEFRCSVRHDMEYYPRFLESWKKINEEFRCSVHVRQLGMANQLQIDVWFQQVYVRGVDHHLCFYMVLTGWRGKWQKKSWEYTRS